MEIAIYSLQSARNAINGGATRLEICASPSEGGLTPAPGLVHAIKSQYSKIPLYCMIRIKPGNFVYTREEMDVMLFDLKILSQNGADGFVFGALTENCEVHKDFCREIISAAAPKGVTFHRAFDQVEDPFTTLEDLISLRFERLLTSGQKNTAIEGVKLLQTLVKKAGDRISIMPGSGVTPNNISTIMEISGANEFHSSAKIRIDAEGVLNKIKLSEDEKFITVANEGFVKQMTEIINQC
ncbi:copper homeostasis protein cutC homolog [Diachasma alloeum]|uniref:copper homeostasis protein cutC homolog n=1 Tax=Diachasma alloeum TaxID=454923 RepID=UPI0007380FF2|nr:copper homeostasis protein cutC homolog [Diachasma alloeum]